MNDAVQKTLFDNDFLDICAVFVVLVIAAVFMALTFLATNRR